MDCRHAALRLWTFCLFLMTGCASVGELAARGEYGEACDQVRSDEESLVLVRSLAAASGLTVDAHAFTLEELSHTFPHVPPVLADQRAILVVMRVSASRLPVDGVEVIGGMWLDTEAWGPHIDGCCDEEAWAWLEDRPWPPPRDEPAGPEGLLTKLKRIGGIVGGFAVGVARDLMTVGTLGLVRPHVDEEMFPGAMLTPGGLIELALRSRGSSSANDAPDAIAGDGALQAALTPAQREALTWSALDEITQPECKLDDPGACTSVRLYESRNFTFERPDALRVQLYFEVPFETYGCLAAADIDLPLGPGSAIAPRINAIFADGPVPLASP